MKQELFYECLIYTDLVSQIFVIVMDQVSSLIFKTKAKYLETVKKVYYIVLFISEPNI